MGLLLEGWQRSLLLSVCRTLTLATLALSAFRMSFGYSVGEFPALPTPAWDVYTACKAYKDAPGDFKNLSDEIKSLHTILDSNSLKAKLQDPNLAPEEQEKLGEILQGCTNDLGDLLIKYKSLESRARGPFTGWDGGRRI